MPASETISSHLSATSTLELYPLRFQFRSSRLRQVNANTVRGALGAALKRIDPPRYEQYFAPRGLQGLPSGFGDPPRPFVLRIHGPLDIGLNLFVTREPAVELFREAMSGIGDIEIVNGIDPITLRFETSPKPVRRISVHFVTPTELKGGEGPEFGILMRRIRDRVSALRTLYGTGPLEIDFQEFGDRADRVQMTSCDIDRIEQHRISRGTGQKHSLGGFVGSARYEGELAEFIPYLEAARFTGVGRQTVWGKGEISFEEN